MKTSYVLALCLILASGRAQLSLTKDSNCPFAGTNETHFYYDSTTTIPKDKGVNKSWNFSSIVASTNSSTTYSYITLASTPSPSSYPTANLAVTDGAGSYEYYNLQPHHLDLLAKEPGSFQPFKFSNSQRLMIWPFTYKTSNSDNFSGTFGSSSFNGKLNICGTGTGTVTLPGGITYTNCLQITRTETNNISSSFTFSNREICYEYWSECSRSPIITIRYIALDIGDTVMNNYVVSITNSHLSNTNLALEEQKIDKTSLEVFPNPVKEKLYIVLEDNAIAQEIELLDINGKLILSDNNTNTLKTSNLSKGIYLLKVKNKDAYLQKQVIISE